MQITTLSNQVLKNHCKANYICYKIMINCFTRNSSTSTKNKSQVLHNTACCRKVICVVYWSMKARAVFHLDFSHKKNAVSEILERFINVIMFQCGADYMWLLCGRVRWCIFCVCVLGMVCRNQTLGNVPVFVHLKCVFCLILHLEKNQCTLQI